MIPHINFGVAALGAVLGLLVLWRAPRSLPHLSFAVGMWIFAAEIVTFNLGFSDVGATRVVFWQKVRFFILSFLPSAWLLFSLSYSRGNSEAFLKKWKIVLWTSLLLPLGLTFLFSQHLVLNPETYLAIPSGGSYYHLGHYDLLNRDSHLPLAPSGLLITAIVLLSSVAILMNLERTFRATVGTLRWQVKFMILGLGVLFSARIFTTSQTLLFMGINLSIQWVNTAALFIACILMISSLWRTKTFNIDVYPSQSLIQNSLTIILTGIYLILVGGLGELVNFFGGDAAFPIKAFFVLIALVFLTLLFLSDRFQLHYKRFVSRHFRRPLYDYRQVWRTVATRTTSRKNETDLSSTVCHLISDLFQALTVTIWLPDDNREHLTLASSTAFSPQSPAEIPKTLSLSPELMDAFKNKPEPFDLHRCQEPWIAELKSHNPDQFHEGGNRVCIPMFAKDEFQGCIVMGDRVSGIPFSYEEFELLKSIGDQVAGDLLNLQLSQRLLQAKEMEAFQTMAAFFVHDLKNTASTLSIMLQNLSVHFGEPAFREDALRAVSKSVDRIKDLIQRLSLLRDKLELKLSKSDLNEMVAASIATLDGVTQSMVKTRLNPAPELMMDSEQMQKVVVNLILNAKDASPRDGIIEVETDVLKGWARLTVTDHGTGMSPEFIARRLFRPFQTTKKRGIGIGMFHSKMIVEAHRGKIEVQSEPGVKTSFHVLLPLEGNNP